jgi:hypothetical protein
MDANDIRLAATDESLTKLRYELASYASQALLAIGTELHVVGNVFGTDRVQGASPFGHGSNYHLHPNREPLRQTVVLNADQISFDTPAAQAMLNNSVRVQGIGRHLCYAAWKD